jgi:hypothetical protein
MTTRRGCQADRRATRHLSAALLTCVLALTLATVSRAPAGQHHLARAMAVVGATTNDVHYAAARSDLHAVADPASAGTGSHGFATSAGHPVAHLDARTADTPRVRGPPERAA